MCEKKYDRINHRLYLWLIIALYVVSCAPLPITVRYFPNKLVAGKDSTATIKWSFDNADRVRVKGIDTWFKPTDSLMVRVDNPMKYNVIAYQGDVDSLINTCIVSMRGENEPDGYKGLSEVRKDEAVKRKGNVQQIKLTPSMSNTDYFIGLDDSRTSFSPVTFKVMRTIYGTGDKEIAVRFVLLDQYGNHLHNAIKKNKDKFIINAENKCDNFNIFFEDLVKSENYDSISPDNADLSIILDNSAVAQSNQMVLFYIREFFSRLFPGDNISFSFFNQNYGGELGLSPCEDAVKKLSALSIPDNTGTLNGLYRASLNAVNSLKNGRNKTKALIILTYYDDNSSISFDINDCAQYARDNDIPVYVIALGSAVRSYYLKYLTDLTGGRLYFLFDDELENISDILTEISLSLRYYYELKLPNTTNSNECLEMTTNIFANIGDFKLTEKLNTVLKPYGKFSFPQSLCTFEKNSFKINPDFNIIFESLAKILQDNPQSEIQLTGHSFDEGTTGFGKDLSMRRAEEARKKLVDHGVNPDQVKLKDEGSAKPNFLFIQNPWQEFYNRRVEIRWLDPSILPYEIYAEDAKSETDAFDLIYKWEKRGQKAYFDRYMQGDIPYYKVKLWGYSKLEDARKAAKTLSAKYKTALTVE